MALVWVSFAASADTELEGQSSPMITATIYLYLGEPLPRPLPTLHGLAYNPFSYLCPSLILNGLQVLEESLL
jgi:hypothetical protein